MSNIESITTKYESNPEVVESSLNNIKNRSVILLCVSGKIGAGKDTIAPKVLEAMGYNKNIHLSFADSLKEEIDVVIEIIQNSETHKEAYDLVRKVLNTVKGDQVVDVLWDEVKSGVVKKSKDRTVNSRKALQLWGTEVRRSVDEDYWVKTAIRTAFNHLSAGRSVYFTDSRFPNEAEAITELYGNVVRLLVSPDVQAKRVFDRDGTVVTEDARNHSSETALDDFPFKNVVNTDELTIDEVVDRIVEMIN